MTGLANQLERLSHRADHIDIDHAVESAFADAATSLPRRPGRGHRSATVALAVAASVVTVVALAAVATRDRETGRGGPGTDPPSSQQPLASDMTTSAVELGPVVTLDPSRTVDRDNPPVTVDGTAPTDWYELQPDLDVAWYNNNGGSWLCFRTPEGQQCLPDRFAPTENGGGPMLVGTSGGQALVVTLDPGDEITLTLSGGTTLRAPVVRDPQINWGIARIELPSEEIIDEAAEEYLLDRAEISPTAAPPLTNESAVGAEPPALQPGSDWAYSHSETSPGVTRVEFIYTARPGDSDDTQHGTFTIQFGDEAHRVPAEMLINTSLATVLGQPITLQSDETGTLHAGETELNRIPVYFTFEMVGIDVAAATLSELRRLDVPLDEWVAQHSASTNVATETSALP